MAAMKGLKDRSAYRGVPFATARERTWIDPVLAWLLLATAFAPLLTFSGLLYPHIASKVFYFEVLVELAAALLLLKAALGTVAVPAALRRPWSWLPLGFLGVAYLASLFGIDFENSFYSTLARYDGLLTLTHLIAYFYVLLFVFQRSDWRKLLMSLASVGGIVALVSLAQAAGMPGIAPPEIHGRADAFIGNAELTAGFLIIAFFLAVLFSVRHGIGARAKYAWMLVAATDLAGIALTGTRSAIVALAFSALAGAIFAALFSCQTKRRVAALGLALVLIGGVAGAYMLRDSLRESDVLLVRRLASVSVNDATTRSRLYLWSHSLAFVQERPLLGFGNQNQPFVLNAVYDPSAVEEGWLDRAHNAYLDSLIENGTLGLVAYLMVYAMFARFAYALRKRDPPAALVFSLLLVAYAVQNFFAFDSLSSALAFWAIAGYLLAAGEESAYSEPVVVPRAFRALAGVVACMVVVSAYWTVYKPLRANAAMAASFRQHDVAGALRLARESFEYAPADMELGSLAYSLYLNVETQNAVTPADKKRVYEFSYDALGSLTRAHPWHAKPYLLQANLMLERPPGEPFDEAAYERALAQAKALGPKRAEEYYLLARYALERHAPPQREDYMAAARILGEYIGRVPRLAKPHFLSALFLLSAGEKERAASAFADGLALYTPTPELAQDIVNYYLMRGDYRSSEQYFAYLLAENPDDPQRTVDLAKVYVLNGKTSEAVRLLRALMRKDPSAVTIDPTFIHGVLNAADELPSS